MLVDLAHVKVQVTGNRLPSISMLLDPSRFQYSSFRPEPSTALGRMAENPYSILAIALSAVIFLVSILIPAYVSIHLYT